MRSIWRKIGLRNGYLEKNDFDIGQTVKNQQKQLQRTRKKIRTYLKEVHTNLKKPEFSRIKHELL